MVFIRPQITAGLGPITAANPLHMLTGMLMSLSGLLDLCVALNGEVQQKILIDLHLNKFYSLNKIKKGLFWS